MTSHITSNIKPNNQKIVHDETKIALNTEVLIILMTHKKITCISSLTSGPIPENTTWRRYEQLKYYI